MRMPKDSFPFKVGDLDCLVIRDTVSPMDLDRLFPSIKREEIARLLEQYHVPRGEVMDVMCLLICTDQQKVLIDTGWGIGNQKGGGNLISILRANGITPEEIDTVVISHGHPDHIGGNTDDKGNPLFPKARYIMFKKEWEFWTSIPDLKQIEKRVQQEMHAYVRKNLIPLQEQFTLVDEKVEFLPGIKFIRAPGHSPFHCILNISSGTERLLYGGDLIHHPLQIVRPECSIFGDFNPEQAHRTRVKIISQAAKNNTLVFASHFPFPGLGRIIRKGELLTWQPLKIDG
jgi:glyoxylase-like metal-dependent hydrolase (beta-lactamase superfamily II)